MPDTVVSERVTLWKSELGVRNVLERSKQIRGKATTEHRIERGKGIKGNNGNAELHITERLKRHIRRDSRSPEFLFILAIGYI